MCSSDRIRGRDELARCFANIALEAGRAIMALYGERDPGRPYKFKDAETLIDDFFNEVESVLRERGIGMTVVRVENIRRRK